MIYTSYTIIDYNHYAPHAWILRCQRVPMKSQWSLKPSCSSSKMISTRPQSSNAFNRQDRTVVCGDMYHRFCFAKGSEYPLGKAIFMFHHFHANSLAMSLLWLPVRPVHSFSVQKWTKYSRNCWDSILTGSIRPGSLSWPHLPLSIHLGSRQSPADSTLQRRCRPEIISASSLKLPAWTRDHTPPSHDFDGLGHSSVLVEQEFGNFKHWFLGSVLAMVNLVILSSSYIASSIVANELRERSCNLG